MLVKSNHLIQNPCVMLVSILHAVPNTGSSAEDELKTFKTFFLFFVFLSFGLWAVYPKKVAATANMGRSSAGRA